ncbi:MAG: hypothetical protein MRY59_13035 [Aquisalinus sp.]|nr:hypothetical protein [Aquisalinus sp.]
MSHSFFCAGAALATLAAGCTPSPPEPALAASEAKTCDEPVAEVLEQLIGTWSLEIEADEGWTGYGQSTIARDPLRACSLLETQSAVFNQESPTPFQNTSTSLIIHDTLSDTLKIVSNDRRGYTHLGFSTGRTLEDLTFEVGQAGGRPSTRRIHYRHITEDSFEWVWQGRPDENSQWQDRLTVRYDRASASTE